MGAALLLAALSVTIALPLLDMSVGASSPWHEHLVLGARDEAEQAHALADHDHEPLSGKRPTRAAMDGVQVLSIPGSAGPLTIARLLFGDLLVSSGAIHLRLAPLLDAGPLGEWPWSATPQTVTPLTPPPRGA
jgi:hypothetical protein